MPYKNAFKLSNKQKPKLSCDTRWNSSYDMAESLNNEKEFICNITKNDKDCKLSEQEWEFINDFVVGFKPVAHLTTSLQNEQLTFGDFYLMWIRCKLRLEKENSSISKKLSEKMTNREEALLNNNSFLAAIYMDQRINYRNSPLISEDQRLTALEHLKKTWRVMERVAKGDQQSVNVDNVEEGGSASTADVLEEYLQSHEVSVVDVSNGFFDELDDLSRLHRLKLEKNQTILDHWFSQKHNKPELYALATVALSTPATQVSVERSFSALALILTKLRSRLGESSLANILFIRLDAELLKQITF